MKTTRLLAQMLYSLVGTIFLAAGVSVLLLKTGWLPADLQDTILDAAGGNSETLHIFQELSSVLVFAGLITFWFVGHYEQSRTFHWAMTGFWALIALVHWFDIRGPFGSVVGPLINTIPFILFVAIGLLRAAKEGDESR